MGSYSPGGALPGGPQKIACPPGNHGLGKVSRSVAGLSQDSSGAAEHSSISARVCVQWCRSEGLVADQLANGVDAPSGQLSPGIWLSTCVNGTMGTGWTHEYVTCTFSAVRAVANRQLPRKGFPQVPARLPRLPGQGRRSLGRYLDRRRGERDDLSDAVPEHANVPVGIRRATDMDIPLTTLKY